MRAVFVESNFVIHLADRSDRACDRLLELVRCQSDLKLLVPQVSLWEPFATCEREAQRLRDFADQIRREATNQERRRVEAFQDACRALRAAAERLEEIVRVREQRIEQAAREVERSAAVIALDPAIQARAARYRIDGRYRLEEVDALVLSSVLQAAEERRPRFVSPMRFYTADEHLHTDTVIGDLYSAGVYSYRSCGELLRALEQDART